MSNVLIKVLTVLPQLVLVVAIVVAVAAVVVACTVTPAVDAAADVLVAVPASLVAVVAAVAHLSSPVTLYNFFTFSDVTIYFIFPSKLLSFTINFQSKYK